MAGQVIRLRLSNRYATTPVSFENVHIAERAEAGGAELVPGSECALSFNGKSAITLQGGESILSDPVHYPVQPFHSLGISFHVPVAPAQISRHLEAQEALYVSLPGDYSADVSGAAFTTYQIGQANNWVLIEALEVRTDRELPILVTIGDSITDGTASGMSTNQRYPDLLQQRLHEAGSDLVVVNSGIGGNQLTRPFIPQFGRPLLDRFDEDALNIPGASTILVMIGTNDFGINWPDPTITDAVLTGYASLIERAHAAGKRIILGTLPPATGYQTEQNGAPQDFPGVLHGSAQAAESRRIANEWIRANTEADGIVDFERCLADPANPDYLHPDYNSGDYLHPNAAGYAAMARCVDLDDLW